MSYTPREGVSGTRGYGSDFLYMKAEVFLHKISSGKKSYSQGASRGVPKVGRSIFVSNLSSEKL